MQKLSFFICVILIICPILIMAQPGGGPPPDPGTPVPFGGLGILIAIGAGLGIYKIRSSKNNK